MPASKFLTQDGPLDRQRCAILHTKLAHQPCRTCDVTEQQGGCPRWEGLLHRLIMATQRCVKRACVNQLLYSFARRPFAARHNKKRRVSGAPLRNVFVTLEDLISAIGNVSTTSEILAMPEFAY